MCKCVGFIEYGSYVNYITLTPLPPHMKAYRATTNFDKESICLDKCIADEVQYLWSLGITTTGCCCGHNRDEGQISVIDNDIPRMKELGYEVWFNRCRPGDEDSFIPKIK